ncbi:MAG: PIN domain-containing protein [Planctomycetia bacterium]|nr:PIN domain-containing protein [Planctomycetia bacterium]
MARYVVDTNVLLRAVASPSSQHALAVAAITRLLAGGNELFLVPQVLVEFWSVATRPVEVNGYGWPARDAEAKVAELLRQFAILPETPGVFPEWLRLVSRHGITGKQVHDARLVAMLNIHGVPNLLTFNVSDFQPYGTLAVSPEQVR